MFRSTTRCLFACAALLLALAGCSLDDLDRAAMVLPAMDGPMAQESFHEIHRMFDAEKGNALVSELPAQF